MSGHSARTFVHRTLVETQNQSGEAHDERNYFVGRPLFFDDDVNSGASDSGGVERFSSDNNQSLNGPFGVPSGRTIDDISRRYFETRESLREI